VRAKLLPVGAVIAIADLVNCIKMDSELIYFWRETYGADEIAFGHFEPGRYAWMLKNVRRIEPVAAKGRQRLWNWEEFNHKQKRLPDGVTTHLRI
jgi:hypothetical protein